MKNTRKRKRRKMSRRGVWSIIVMAALVGIPIGDRMRRSFYKPPDKSEWLKIEGNFAGHPTEVPEYEEPQDDTDSISLSDESDGSAIDAQKADFNSKVKIPKKCVVIQLEASDIHTGCLLRLDDAHSYSGDGTAMTTIAHKKGDYDVHSADMLLMPVALDALDKMTQGYSSATGKHDLLVYSTTESGGIYNRTLPDMPTGYCVDLATEDEEGRIQPFYSRGEWLEENAHRYGFVFSYTEEDEDETGVDDAPYHLRYVGRIHAGIMHDRQLTLSRYLDLLTEHSTDDPLYYDDGSHTYTVYYVPKGFGSTDVPVPQNGKYEVSGDNDNGFVVSAEGKIG
ncbi:MAG: D-alanyl-D-alanine carboxypeptidase family protein [Oscillospiraceae bacterium]|nr:D-alanyl-D-alanine carboxypeptidase family protein [Oscillospiraceae bacterium]